MKKVNFYILMGLMLGTLSPALNAATNQSTPASAPVNQPAKKDASTTNEKYDIMNRDQIDNSNTLAIPLDDSEIEDEEEIDRDEDKEVFPLPHSPR